MTLLFFDAESSDLLKPDVPLGDPSQPWAVAIAAELTDDEGRSLDFISTRIRADGRSIKPAAEAVHGFSTRSAAKAGVSEVAALGVLCGFAAQATILVGHGIEFDRRLIESILIRRGKDTKLWTRPGLATVCTMLAAAPVCRIPSGRDDGAFKWPSLDEACEVILGEAPRTGKHSAWGDLGLTKRLYFALRERRVLEAA